MKEWNIVIFIDYFSQTQDKNPTQVAVNDMFFNKLKMQLSKQYKVFRIKLRTYF